MWPDRAKGLLPGTLSFPGLLVLAEVTQAAKSAKKIKASEVLVIF